MPASENQRPVLKRRAYTCPSNMGKAAGHFNSCNPLVQVTVDLSPENDLFFPTEYTLREDELACSQSSTRGYTRVSVPHRRTASAPLAPKLALSSPFGSISHYQLSHKRFPYKMSSDGSTDSGVEIVRFITPSAGPSGYSIEPWMSVPNEYQWMQPRPRVIEPWMSVSQDKEQFEQSWLQQQPRVLSVSTAVQTDLEGEDGSEKTASPASGTPRTLSSFQHPHAGIGKPYAPLTQ